MPAPIVIPTPAITATFEAAGKSVYSPRELTGFLREHRAGWKIPPELRAGDLLQYLLSETQLRQVQLRSEDYGGEVRYAWGVASPYEIALSLRRQAYLSHGTAVFLHGLTDQIPKTIYVNSEQSPKPAPREGLTQQRLDAAFSRPQRMSRFEFRSNNTRILLLNSKNTNRLGVEALKGPNGESLEVTNLERTLIDIVVRPAYAGGVFQILEALQAAKGHMSVDVLLRTLESIGHVYPYHQAIGFLMEKAGYDENLCERLRSLGTKIDFYLLHGMRRKQFDAKWRLFYPEGL